MAQNVPINQQNALPLATIAQATPGAIQLLGGQVTRYWSPDDLGINGVSRSAVNIGGTDYLYLATPFLDMRGCSKFAWLVRRTTTAGGAGLIALPSTAPRVQLRMTSTDTPPVFNSAGGGVSADYTGTFVIKTPAVFYPAAPAIGDQQSIVFAWGGMQLGQYGADVSFGPDCRLLLVWGPSVVDPSNIFTSAVWAGS